MAENRANQNPDWNDSGERQANDVPDERQVERHRRDAPEDRDRAAERGDEGRDRAPRTPGRDPKDPWMGGG